MTRGAAAAIAGLGLASFAFVNTEMLPIGLLPQIADALHVGLADAGLLVTLYAFTVALSAAPLTALSARVSRRRLLVALVTVLVAMNVLAAAAPSYWVLFCARFINALAHGVFWSVVGAVAVRLVPIESRGTALAIVFGGVTLATVGGVPLATFVGQQFGWRVAFLGLAAIGVAVCFVLATTVRDRSASAPITPQAVRGLFGHGAFRSLLATTVLVVLGQFVGYTYIIPYVENVNGFAPGVTASLLFVFGITGVIGNVIAGSLANRNAVGASLATNAVIACGLVLLPLCSSNHLAAVAVLGLWGLGAGGLAVGLQTRVYALAPHAPDLASSLFASSFNVGIGGGALLGTLVVRLLGVSRTIPIGAGLALLALVVQSLSALRARAAARGEALADGV